MTSPTGAELRRGPFTAGERVQLTDPKGRMHTIAWPPASSSTPTGDTSPTTT
jgi:tRNA (adenine57-N1/adenine58-N1)-methyltransferase